MHINFAIEPPTLATVGVGSRSGAGKSVYLVDIVGARPLFVLKPIGKVCENKLKVKLVGPLETYAPTAMAFLLTSVIRVFLSLHLEL